MSYNKNLLKNLFGAKAKVLKLFFQHPQLVLALDKICEKTSLKKRDGARLVSDFVRLGVLKKANNNGKKAKKNTKK